MNDERIRAAFHRKVLRRHHANANTLVIDELGLKHGKRRADIAVINGHLNGYEIKGDKDSLSRLSGQVEAYSAVFDRATVIVANRHLGKVQTLLPAWWGVVVCTEGPRKGVSFETVRRATINMEVDGFSVAQLLWRNEAVEILASRGVPARVLRSKRSVLYAHLVDLTDSSELGSLVRGHLKTRLSWRHPQRPSEDDDWSRPVSMS